MILDCSVYGFLVVCKESTEKIFTEEKKGQSTYGFLWCFFFSRFQLLLFLLLNRLFVVVIVAACFFFPSLTTRRVQFHWMKFQRLQRRVLSEHAIGKMQSALLHGRDDEFVHRFCPWQLGEALLRERKRRVRWDEGEEEKREKRYCGTAEWSKKTETNENKEVKERERREPATNALFVSLDYERLRRVTKGVWSCDLRLQPTTTDTSTVRSDVQPNNESSTRISEYRTSHSVNSAHAVQYLVLLAAATSKHLQALDTLHRAQLSDALQRHLAYHQAELAHVRKKPHAAQKLVTQALAVVRQNDWDEAELVVPLARDESKIEELHWCATGELENHFEQFNR